MGALSQDGFFRGVLADIIDVMDQQIDLCLQNFIRLEIVDEVLLPDGLKDVEQHHFPLPCLIEVQKTLVSLLE